MNTTDSLSYILHVSDFHLKENDDENKYAVLALDKLTKRITDRNIKVKYLIHTGDVIDSSDLYERAAKNLGFYDNYVKDDKFDSDRFFSKGKKKNIETFDAEVKRIVEQRFDKATIVLRSFISKLNISHNNVIICCGNHDVLRSRSITDTSSECKLLSRATPGITFSDKADPAYTFSKEVAAVFEPFESFLNKLQVANSKERRDDLDSTVCFELEDLNVLVLNTNWNNPKKSKAGYYCVRCDYIKDLIKEGLNQNKLNVIVAHKPIYEICETARLSYKRYIKTPFMARLHEFANCNGIYLCGDKHTRSIVASSFHDIPHYIGGEPLTVNSDADKQFEVEYNLISINGNIPGRERKIHLKSDDGEKWVCEFRPPENVISDLYNLSKGYIIHNSFDMIAEPSTLRTWENLYQTVYSWSDVKRRKYFNSINKLYLATCKYRNEGTEDVFWNEDKNIFFEVCDRLKKISESRTGNLLNIRGEYSSGKYVSWPSLYVFALPIQL